MRKAVQCSAAGPLRMLAAVRGGWDVPCAPPAIHLRQTVMFLEGRGGSCKNHSHAGKHPVQRPCGSAQVIPELPHPLWAGVAQE